MDDAQCLLVPPLRTDAGLQAIESLTRRLLAQPVRQVLLVDIDHLDADALPHLAEQYSMLDEPAWQLADSDAQRRALLKGAIKLHRQKGTPAAIEAVFDLLNLGAITIEEGRAARCYDGSFTGDGFAVHGDPAQWAVYRVHCKVLLTAVQAATARRMLERIAPARCALHEINFTNARLIHNARARTDGSFSYGAYV